MKFLISLICSTGILAGNAVSQTSNSTNYVDSKPVTIRIIPKAVIEQKYSNEIRKECEASPLFAPKDEFETLALYEIRKKEALVFKETLYEKYRFKYIEWLKYQQQEKDAKEKAKINLIKNSYSKEKLIITADQLGFYDSEKQLFNINIKNETYDLKIPISEAKSFKQRFAEAIIYTDKQLNEDGVTWDYFNYQITHPTTGSVYLLNKKKPLYIDVDPGVRSVAKTGIPKLTADVLFFEPSGNNLLDAGESAVIKLTIRNDGNGSASLLKMKNSTTSSGITYDQEKMIPEIYSGQSQTIVFNLRASKEVQSAAADFSIAFTEENGFQPAPMNISIGTQAFKPPKLEFIEAGIKDNGNGNNIIENSELIDLTALIQNKGQGKADNVRAVFKFDDPNIICTTPDKLNQLIESIAAGESRMLTCSFVVNNSYKGSERLPIRIILSEAEGLYGSNNDIGLQMKQVSQVARNVTVEGRYDQNKDIAAVSLSSDVDRNIPENPEKYKYRYALIIGNEDYSKYQKGLNTESNVDFARQDASTFAKYAELTLGVPKENIVLLTDAISSAMKKEIQKLKKLAQYSEGKAELVFFYAGHGFPDEVTNESYLIPVDIGGSNVRDGISLNNLYKELTEHPAQKITVFLDACFSGGGRNAGLMAARGIKIKPKEAPLRGKLVVFSASTGDQVSLPFNDKKHGMFTYFLLKKIQETKGNCNYKDLGDYIRKEVQINSVRFNEKEQNPQVLFSDEIESVWHNWMCK